MSPKLPVVSGEELVRVLEKLGYVAVRQRGSHVRMYPPEDSQLEPTTVPLHNEVARGTLKNIMRNAGLTPERLKELL